jgi:hypothetical protein
MAAAVATEPLVELDYAAAVDGTTLTEHDQVADPARTRLVVAAQVGPVRLIDNCAAAAGADGPGTDTLGAARHGATDQVRHRQLERIA